MLKHIYILYAVYTGNLPRDALSLMISKQHFFLHTLILVNIRVFIEITGYLKKPL